MLCSIKILSKISLRTNCCFDKVLRSVLCFMFWFLFGSGWGGDKSLRLDHLLIILSEVKTVIEQNILGQTNEF